MSKAERNIQQQTPHYQFPIPDRTFIIATLKNINKPATLANIAQRLELTQAQEIEALHRRLWAMERDGQLVFTRRKCYALPEKMELVKGRVIGHRDGFGFLNVEGVSKDYYISADEMKQVMHGDHVLAQPLYPIRRGRQEVRIVRILAQAETHIIGRFMHEAGISFVVPNDNRIFFDILIPHAPSLPIGSLVMVELKQRPKFKSKAIGQIVEVLGSEMNSDIAVEIALRSHQIPYEWSADVVAQIAPLTEHVSEHDKAHRVDLRNLPLVTIDGDDARDFDDAVYCRKKPGGGWQLWVAIADVSYYVRPHTALDKEASQRGTSVYFPTKVVPMLPEILSNGLCSLNPHVDRLCLVCEMSLSRTGKLTAYRFYNGVMNSHARFTYNTVAQILAGDEAIRAEHALHVADLEQLHQLYQALNQAREARGAIGFESEEAHFIFNHANEIAWIEKRQRNDAHKLIEECMIIANVAAAQFVAQAGEQALYRVHDAPTEENYTDLKKALNEMGLSLNSKKENKPQPKDYANFMVAIANRPDREMLQLMLLRSMKQAIYDPENRGHFGLALKSYAHFTSPIRRYPDLLLHRSIKYLLATAQHTDKLIEHDFGGYHYQEQEMLYFGQHCSMAERRAEEASRDVADWLKCVYMQKHIGEIFTGVVSSVVNFGLFVRLDNLFIDGLVHVSSLENDYYVYDAIRQQLKGESSKHTYRLGDNVQIQVAAVNLDDKKIDFILHALPATKSKKKTTQKRSTCSMKVQSASTETKPKKKTVKQTTKNRKIKKRNPL